MMLEERSFVARLLRTGLLISPALFVLSCGSFAGAGKGAWFEDRTVAAGIGFVHDSGHRERFLMPEMTTGGGALFDMDGDGDLDMYLVQGGAIEADAKDRPPNMLYRNKGDGTFEDVTAGSGADDRGVGQGAAVGDYDNDGDLDLYVTNLGPDVLLQNDGKGRFTDVSGPAGVGVDGWGSSAAFLDYDRDGLLDLFVAQYLNWSPDREINCEGQLGKPTYCGPLTYSAPALSILYRNLGGGRFENRGEASGITTPGTGLGVVVGDYDMDGWPDVYVANDEMPNRLWINQRDGSFSDKASELGAALDLDGKAKAGMGTTAEDIDADGDLDLIAVNLMGETDSLYENVSGSYFQDSTSKHGLSNAASKHFTRFGVGMVDFDNDGYLDMYQANGRVGGSEEESMALQNIYLASDPYAEPNLLLRGLPDGSFKEVEPRGGTEKPIYATSRALVFGDIDSDGGIDVLVVNRGAAPTLLRNKVAGRGNWIQFRVLEQSGLDAVGAVVTVTNGDRKQRRDVRSTYGYLAANDLRVHFGLGAAEQAEQVSVQWNDGGRESFGSVVGGQTTTLRRGTGKVQP